MPLAVAALVAVRGVAAAYATVYPRDLELRTKRVLNMDALID